MAKARNAKTDNSHRTGKQKPRSELVPPDTTCNAHLKTQPKDAKEGDPPKLCARPAGWGTDHAGVGRCKLHGGSLPNHRIAAMDAIAKQGVKQFALPLNVSPQDALLEELHRTAGIVAFYEVQIKELKNVNEMTGPVGTEGATDSGAYQHAKAEANIWVRLHKEERAHLTKVAEVCIKAGIAERQVKIAETQAAMIAQAVKGILTALKIPLDDPTVRATIREHMTTVTSTARELEPGALD